jgi:divalent metal cation (Fe/Co/Zn/Cd) transporter
MEKTAKKRKIIMISLALGLILIFLGLVTGGITGDVAVI